MDDAGGGRAKAEPDSITVLIGGKRGEGRMQDIRYIGQQIGARTMAMLCKLCRCSVRTDTRTCPVHHH